MKTAFIFPLHLFHSQHDDDSLVARLDVKEFRAVNDAKSTAPVPGTRVKRAAQETESPPPILMVAAGPLCATLRHVPVSVFLVGYGPV
jgi:hypothetical protein